MKKFAATALLLVPLLANALPRAQSTPGGVAVLPLDIPREAPRPEASYNGRPVFTYAHLDGWYAYVGVSLKAKLGTHHLLINGEKTPFSVADKAYETQSLTIKNKRKVNPNPEDVKRISAEYGRKLAAKRTFSEQLLGADFIEPTPGPRSSSFGLRRIFNGQPRNPHSGMDIAAPTGQAIVAPADGIVREVGDFFFSGNLVYLDHGQGLVSLYAHLSKTDVAVGDRVKQGQKIGEVGATGRVTGPHLHWSVGLNGEWVDPALFLPAHKQ
ncbi:MAG: peptidoglycan DD-metalloendopeptidase family protein [Granulosicoccaceae bacterium]